MDDTGGTQSITRGIGLLKIVAQGRPEGLTLAQVAERASLHRATAHRLLAALTRERLLEQDASHRYHGGVELWVLGEAAARRFDIRELCRLPLERITAETQDTVYLSVRSGYEAICVARYEGAFPIRTLSLNSEVGSLSAMALCRNIVPPPHRRPPGRRYRFTATNEPTGALERPLARS